MNVYNNVQIEILKLRGIRPYLTIARFTQQSLQGFLFSSPNPGLGQVAVSHRSKDRGPAPAELSLKWGCHNIQEYHKTYLTTETSTKSTFIFPDSEIDRVE